MAAASFPSLPSRTSLLAPSAPLPEEVVISHTRRVSCNGGGGALGHPVVFYEMGDDGEVTCLYCDKRFVYQPGEHDDDH